MARKRLIDALYGFENVEKTFLFGVSIQISSLMNFFYRVLVLWFVHILKAIHLQQLKGIKSSKLGLWKGYHLSIEGIRKGFLFYQKWYIKGKGLELVVESTRLNFFEYPRAPTRSQTCDFFVSFLVSKGMWICLAAKRPLLPTIADTWRTYFDMNLFCLP